MALNAYLKIKGTVQGDIKGSVTQKGREGRIAVIAADHGVSLPHDLRAGITSGTRAHRPFILTKELDQSTPLLYRALITGETLECEIQFFAPAAATAVGATGAEVNRYTVRLSDARIDDIHFAMPNNRHPELSKLAEYEEVAFSYRKIEWRWTQGAVSTIDEIGE